MEKIITMRFTTDHNKDFKNFMTSHNVHNHVISSSRDDTKFNNCVRMAEWKLPKINKPLHFIYGTELHKTSLLEMYSMLCYTRQKESTHKTHPIETNMTPKMFCVMIAFTNNYVVPKESVCSCKRQV